MHPYFTIFGRDFPTYGLMSMIGVGVAALYLFLSNRSLKRLGRGGIPGEDLLNLLLMAFVGALIGAKVLYLITALPALIHNWAFLMANPGELLNLLVGGMVFYGGFLGGLLAVFLYCRKYKIPLAEATAVITPAVPLFHIFGRIGCFLAGCCWGVEMEGGVVFHNSLGAPNGVPLLPLQLIEAGCNVVIFIVLAVLVRHIKQRALVLPLYILIYGALRFVLEFFRGDMVRGVALLSTSQWISLALIVAVVVLYFTRLRKKVRPPTPQE